LVQEKVDTRVYCKTNDHIDDIFKKPLFEDKFFKLHNMVGIQKDAIMEGCLVDMIPPIESLEPCVDGGVLEP
jgi:hypothetical protein